MDLAIISLILSSITAVAAVISPVISSIISIKSSEKMKHLELYSPHIYDAVDRMLKTYSKLPILDEFFVSDDEARKRVSDQFQSQLKEFSFACYDVITLISSKSTQNQVLEFLNELRSKGCVNDEITAKFEVLILCISHEFSSFQPKIKKRISREKKAADSK